MLPLYTLYIHLNLMPHNGNKGIPRYIGETEIKSLGLFGHGYDFLRL